MATSIQILENQPKSAAVIMAQRQSIVECMRAAMQKDVDYGTIPGTNKPSLYKPGSEKLLSMFHLAAKPVVEDLSTPDTIRYRVSVIVSEIGSGRQLGEGVGEASSAESKYQWRAAVCDREFDETPVDRRRKKWKNGRSGPFTIPQVRADMEDVANTILKMAKKRAQIDAVLTVTAASDVFGQDLEDLPPEMAVEAEHDSQDVSAGDGKQPLPDSLPRRDTAAPTPQRATQPAAPVQGEAVVSEAQSRRFYAIRKSSECYRSDGEIQAKLKERFGHSDDRKLPSREADAYVCWLKGGAW